jgi:hypothetical protein
MNKIDHLLVCLAEECSELAQACTKALRFGVVNYHPDIKLNNLRAIQQEYSQLFAVIKLLHHEGMTINICAEDVTDKLNSLEKWMDYSRAKGLLEPEEASKLLVRSDKSIITDVSEKPLIDLLS